MRPSASSSRKPIRIKIASLDDQNQEEPGTEEEDQDGKGRYPIGTGANSFQPRLLSFQDTEDDDIEVEEFKVKKSVVPEDITARLVSESEEKEEPKPVPTRLKLKSSFKSQSCSKPASKVRNREDETIGQFTKIGQQLTRSGGDQHQEDDKNNSDSLAKALSCMKILDSIKPDQQRKISHFKRPIEEFGETEWEVNQLSKGLTKLQLEQISPLSRSRMISIENEDAKTLNPAELKVEDAEVEKIISGEAFKSHQDQGLVHIAERLEKLRSSVNWNTQKLNSLGVKLQSVRDEMTATEKELADVLAPKFYRVQKYRSSILDLIENLSENIPKIVKLEGKILQSMAVTARSQAEKRRINTNSKYQESIKSDQSDLQNLTCEENDHLNLNDGKPEPNQESKHGTEQVDIKTEASNIFANTVNEFSTLENVLELFCSWESEDPKLYKFCCTWDHVPKIVAQFARMETLSWDPLSSNCDSSLNLAQFCWHNLVQRYGRLFDPRSKSNYACLMDIIKNVTLPWIDRLVEAKWNPLSPAANSTLINLVLAIQEKTNEKESSNPILTAVVTKFRNAVDNDVFIPIFSPEIFQREPAIAFASEQFLASLQLFECLTAWAGILDDTELRSIALDGLLARYLLLGIRTSPTTHEAVERAKKISDVIPKQWLTHNQEEEMSMGLQLFANCLASLQQKCAGESAEIILEMLEPLKCEELTLK